MPVFSDKSKMQLATCHMDLQVVFNEVIKHIDCTIIEGHRGQSAQNAAFAAGESKLRYPNGNHNATPSNAVDVALTPIDWGKTQRFVWFAGYVQGIAQMLYDAGRITHLIRWGGNWSADPQFNTPQKFNDYDHFELVVPHA